MGKHVDTPLVCIFRVTLVSQLSFLNSPGLGETTGLDFSPDMKRMYISFQRTGQIFEIKRLDGYPFGGTRLDIKYHNV